MRPPSTVELSQHASRLSELSHCTLTVMTGGIGGAVITVGAAPLLIGRSHQCEIRLDDPSVSSLHAEISRAGSDLYLRDLGSTNGTFVNGSPLTRPRELRDGDRIQLGRDGLVRVSFADEDEERALRTLYERAIRDRLTGLYNRAFFDDRVDVEFAAAERHHQPLALLLLDLDHFKALNDNFGHPAGDEALRAVGVILRAEARREDIAARFGGEEFVLLARGLQLTEASAVAERLRCAIQAAPITYRGKKIAISGSFGVAVHTVSTRYKGPADLLFTADQALYKAKRAGRNRVAIAR